MNVDISMNRAGDRTGFHAFVYRLPGYRMRDQGFLQVLQVPHTFSLFPVSCNHKNERITCHFNEIQFNVRSILCYLNMRNSRLSLNNFITFAVRYPGNYDILVKMYRMYFF